MAKHCGLARTPGTGISVLAGVMLFQSAVAQEQQPTEKVIITGSAIPRTETETPAPVQVITREEIQKIGATTINDVLKALTANGGSNLQQAFNGAFAGGAAGVALRGMTVDATLVLIDGKRMAPYPISDDGQRSFVDVANLPLSVIERIEILKGSGSALYGSDAIAGVVNIITRKTYVGSEVAGDFGDSTHNDGITYHVSATHGWGDLAADGHNTYLNAEYRHQNAIRNSARSQYSNYDYFDTYAHNSGNPPTLPGVVPPGANPNMRANLFGMTLPINNPGTPTATYGKVGTQLPGCTTPPVPPRKGCGYNPADFYQIEPDTENLDLWLRHTMDLVPGWQAVGTASVFESKAQQISTPRGFGATLAWASLTGHVNTGDPKAQPVVLPAGNRNNPYCGLGSNPVTCTQQAWLSYRLNDLGGTDTEFTTDMYRLALDLTGAVYGWDTTTSIGGVRGVTDITYRGYASYSGFLSVIANNSYALPGSPSAVAGMPNGFNSAATLATVYPNDRAVATSQLQYLELSGTRDVPWFTLPGGPIGVGVGVSVHHWGQDDPGQPGTITADRVALGTSFIHGTETDQAGHAEVSFLPLKWIEVDGQVRFDKVVGVGTAWSPNALLKLTPIEQVALRGTYSKGFRAPGPGEKGDSGVTFFQNLPSDPARCPFTHLPTDCGGGPAQGFGATTGNSSLQPEKSEAYGAGIVLQPVKWASVSADWYKIIRTNYIFGGASSLIRGSPTSDFPNLPGPVIGVVSPYQNLGKDVTSGLEFDAQARHELPGYGTLSFHGTWTHLFYYNLCGAFGTAFVESLACVDVAGTHGPQQISGNTGTPKDRGQAIFAWDQGPYEAGFNINYVSGYDLTDPSVGANGPPSQPGNCLSGWYTPCRVASFTDVDLFGHYDLTKRLQISGHILNVLDKDAPFDPQAQYGRLNYSANWAQQGGIGRFFQVGLRYAF
jgi:iron complex outermembrane receptor protein